VRSDDARLRPPVSRHVSETGGGSTEMPHSTGEFGVVNRSARIHVKYLGQRRLLSLCDRLRALVDHVTGISDSGPYLHANRGVTLAGPAIVL
jgi:hypothetical protein